MLCLLLVKAFELRCPGCFGGSVPEVAFESVVRRFKEPDGFRGGLLSTGLQSAAIKRAF
jgi:hypothetical protein